MSLSPRNNSILGQARAQPETVAELLMDASCQIQGRRTVIFRRQNENQWVVAVNKKGISSKNFSFEYLYEGTSESEAVRAFLDNESR